MYYLQSRYYVPAWGRFLNADGYVSTGTGLLGYNMYSYCNNNPIMYVDNGGTWSTQALLTGLAITVLTVTVVSVAALVLVTAPVSTPILTATAGYMWVGGTALAGIAASVSLACDLDEEDKIENEQLLDVFEDTIEGGVDAALLVSPGGAFKKVAETVLTVKNDVLPAAKDIYEWVTGKISWDEYAMRTVKRLPEKAMDLFNDSIKKFFTEVITE